MAVYPTALKVWAALVDHVDSIMAAHHNTAYDEISAIEAELGLLPKGAYADVAARLAALLSTVDHTAIGDGAPHHAAVTLGGGSDTALALVAQALTLAAVGDFDLSTLVAIDHGDGIGAHVLLAADANYDRIVLVRAVGIEAGAGTVEFDVGSPADPDGCFNDLATGAWAVGAKYIGAYMLPATEALNCTIIDAGTAGAVAFYVIAIIPLVSTANLRDGCLAASAAGRLKLASSFFNLPATVDDKFAAASINPSRMVSILDDPGHYAQARGRAVGVWTARTTVPADGDTVTVGTDVFEFDRIDLDSTDDTANDDFNNVTDPLTVELTAVRGYAQCGVDGVAPLAVGQLVFLGAEYLRVTVIAGNNVTFARARCGGGAAAAHADAVDIFWSASHITGATANISTGIQGASVAAAVGTPVLVETINTLDGAVAQSQLVAALSLTAGADFLITARAVGVLALDTTEVAGNFTWDSATMLRGTAAGRKRSYAAAYTVLATESTDLVYVPLPFAPAQVYYSVLRAGAIVVWDGTITITAAVPPIPDYILFTDGGAATFVAGDILSILAIE